VVFLWWFSNTGHPALAEFRRSQIEFFSEIGFVFTPPRIVAMAIGAGVCEELLFRGVLQTWINGFAPVLIAIIVSNVVFGLLHMRTAMYAVIAGCVGAYFGALYALTDNLLTAIVAHGLYDAVALEYTRRAIAVFRREKRFSS
ncbi:MAG: CPBP family intramembrane glutamic endopeptidase, partial [Hyphococcus sp.]